MDTEVVEARDVAGRDVGNRGITARRRIRNWMLSIVRVRCRFGGVMTKSGDSVDLLPYEQRV